MSSDQATTASAQDLEPLAVAAMAQPYALLNGLREACSVSHGDVAGAAVDARTSANVVVLDHARG
jgi:hypothetical protein